MVLWHSACAQSDLEAFARRRPFQPFEIQRFRMKSVEQFIVGRHDVATLAPTGTIAHLSIGLISTIRPLPMKRRRKA